MPAWAGSIGFDPELGGRSYSIETSSVSLSGTRPGSWIESNEAYPAYLFTGYLNLWYAPLGNPEYGRVGALWGSALPSSPQQVLVENMSQSMFGSLSGYSDDEMNGIVNSFFAGQTQQNMLLAHVATLSPDSGPSMQFLGPNIREVSPSGVPEPRPGTLVLLGCCVIAVGLAVANRNVSGLQEPQEAPNQKGWPDV